MSEEQDRFEPRKERAANEVSEHFFIRFKSGRAHLVAPYSRDYGSVNSTMTARDERFDIQIEPGRHIKIVLDSNAQTLNDQHLVNYREYRWEFIK